MKNLKLFALLFLAPILVYAGYAEIGASPQLGPARTACTVTTNSGATNYAFIGTNCWQIGDTLHIEGQLRFTGAGGAGAVFRIQLPTGYTIATGKLSNGTVTSAGEASATGGCRTWDDASVGYRVACPVFYDTGGVQNQVAFELGGGNILDSDFAVNDSFLFKIEVPVW